VAKHSTLVVKMAFCQTVQWLAITLASQTEQAYKKALNERSAELQSDMVHLGKD
jgi:hypothetical protein